MRAWEMEAEGGKGYCGWGYVGGGVTVRLGVRKRERRARESERERERERARARESERERASARRADRKTDRQTDRQRERERERNLCDMRPALINARSRSSWLRVAAFLADPGRADCRRCRA